MGLERLRQKCVDEPDNGEAIFEYGRILFGLKKFPEAIVWLERAAKICPSSTEIWATLAFSFRENGERQSAIGALREGLRHIERSVDLLAMLGSMLTLEGELNEAEVILRSALALADGDHSIHCVNVDLAECLFKMGRFNEALELCEDTMCRVPMGTYPRGSACKLREEIQAAMTRHPCRFRIDFDGSNVSIIED
jgi:tetratricopeptide (TPR) repeat protein